MGVRGRVSWCFSLALMLFLLMMCAPSAAIVAQIEDGSLPESQNEGELIEYTIVVSGIPKQAKTIEMNTDLTPVPETTLWQPDGTGFTVSGGDESLNDNSIELREKGEFADAINVTVSGRAPVLTSVEIVDGVVVTRRLTQTTGYVYYHIRALDENGDILGTATTETFSVTIPGDEAFLSRLNTITDPEMRAIIDDLYTRGLREEADDLLSYAEVPKDPAIPVIGVVVIALVVLVIGFGAGMLFGQIRAKNIQEFQNEYKGD